MDIRTKRIYETPNEDDGFRVLVDRIWPRGIAKNAAGIDLWLKEVAPSTDLRKWFAHDPFRWKEFRARYRREIETHLPAMQALAEQARRGRITLLYAARDTEHNQAIVLAEYLRDHLQQPG